MKRLNIPEPLRTVLRDNDLRSRYMLNLSLWANLLVTAFKMGINNTLTKLEQFSNKGPV